VASAASREARAAGLLAGAAGGAAMRRLQPATHASSIAVGGLGPASSGSSGSTAPAPAALMVSRSSSISSSDSMSMPGWAAATMSRIAAPSCSPAGGGGGAGAARGAGVSACACWDALACAGRGAALGPSRWPAALAGGAQPSGSCAGGGCLAGSVAGRGRAASRMFQAARWALPPPASSVLAARHAARALPLLPAAHQRAAPARRSGAASPRTPWADRPAGRRGAAACRPCAPCWPPPGGT
jgi:type VI secretion system secreted protein VgrG